MPGAARWRRWARARASRPAAPAAPAAAISPAAAPGPTRTAAGPSLASLVLCAVLGTGLGGAVAGDSRPAPTPDSTTTTGPAATTDSTTTTSSTTATGPATTTGSGGTTATTRIQPTGCRVDCPPAPPRSPTGPPTRVRIPPIRVDSTLARLRLDRTGRLAAPTDFAEAGWYAGGAAPGDVGPAVIAGHVDSEAGPAVFHRLSELRPGDRIEVRRDAGWVPFRVTGLSRHAKDDFPTAAVYGPTPGPELRLITCDGVFDRPTGHYLDNLVVFAVVDLPVVIPTSAAG